jgi:crossover junction endodeoxyribonuclease RuvC
MTVEKKIKVCMGIDPGISGAIACVTLDGLRANVWDMPTETRGKKQALSPGGLAELFRTIRNDVHVASVALELVGSMPAQGIASAFNFGETFGLIKGVIAANQFVYTLVRPTMWKRDYGLLNKDKDESRTTAMKLFPHSAGQLTLKKNVDRAEAMLIALHCVRLVCTGGAYDAGE